MPPNPSGTPRYTRTQRRLLTVSAGLGVAVLAGVAFVVTYADLRALVVEGHAPRRFAPAYPVMFDVLITVTILALVVARNSRWWVRWPRWLLLLVLLAGAAAASVQRATKGYAALPDDALKAGTAVAPHVMLLLAIWLWLAMFKQARAALARRAARPAEPAGDDGPPPDAESAGAPDADAGPEAGRRPAEPAVTAEEPGRRDPWAAQEPPAAAALDWALVPYDPEPAPYEPDPAVQPYEPDPLRSYEPDPIPEPATIPDPITTPEPITRREPATDPGIFVAPEPAPAPEPIAFSEPRAISEPPAGPEPIAIPEPAASPEAAASPEPVTFEKPPPQSSLPTDIKLVGRPAATTRPDIVMPGATEPDAGAAPWAGDPPPEPDPPAGGLRTEPVTVRDPASAGDEDGADVPVVDRAEDPDAGDDPLVPGPHADDAGPEGPQSTAEDVERWSAEAAEDARRWSEDTAEGLRTDRPGPPGPEPERTTEVEWRPPSSRFRSSPTPPDE